MTWSNFQIIDDSRRARPDLPIYPCPVQIIYFRQFRVIPKARRLLRSGYEVEIGGRAFDLLLVLLENKGTVVEKTRIFERVWPFTTVDESNLRFQIGVLRKVLGKDRDAIKTVVGRGYMLVEDLALEKGHSK